MRSTICPGKGRLSAMARSCVVDGALLLEKNGPETATLTRVHSSVRAGSVVWSRAGGGSGDRRYYYGTPASISATGSTATCRLRGSGLTLDRDKLAKILGLLGSDKTGEILSAARAANALIRNANTGWAEVLKQNVIADDARAVHTDNEAPTLLAEHEYKVLALGAEIDNLRNRVRQLIVENNTLREQAARRLAHRILDGVKQSGQALRALAVALDGSAPRAQHVVHGLVAAGIALALGIVAFLALQDVAMLGEPSVSSEQETPEATARSGELPAEAERRGGISEQPSSAAMVTPEAIPKPPASDAALAPVEDMTTLPTLPAAIDAPGQTAQTPEAPPPVFSSGPAEEQAAPPATSLTTSPPPRQSSPNQRLPAAEMAALVTRGDNFLSAGDIVSARLFYERAADGGDRGAALRLSATFDPAFLSWTGVRGIPDDPAQASSWYRRAVDLGNPAAQEHPQNLEQQGVPEPGSPPH